MQFCCSKTLTLCISLFFPSITVVKSPVEMVDLLAFKVFIPFCSLSVPIPSLFVPPPPYLSPPLLHQPPQPPLPPSHALQIRIKESQFTENDSGVQHHLLFSFLLHHLLSADSFFISFHRHFLLLPLLFFYFFLPFCLFNRTFRKLETQLLSHFPFCLFKFFSRHSGKS